EARIGSGVEPVVETKQVRLVDRQLHAPFVFLYRIDHVVGVEGAHVLGFAAGVGARVHRHLVVQQRGADGNLEIDVALAGDGDHTAAPAAAQARFHQVVRQVRVHAETGNRYQEVLDFQQLDLFLVVLHDHHLVAAIGQGAGQHAPGVAVTADQVEGFVQIAHQARQPCAAQGSAVGRVLQQGDDGTDGKQPGNDSQVNTDHGPHALGLGEGIGHFPETYGAARITDNIERFEEAHAPGITLVVSAGYQGKSC